MFDTIDERVAHLTAPLGAWAAQDLADRPVALVPDDVVALLQSAEMLMGEALRRLAVADRTGEAARLGGGSTAAWLREAAHLDDGGARTLLRTARTVADHLPATRAALATGDLTLHHAQVLARAVTPARAEQAERRYPGGMAGAERDLLAVAVLATPTQTHRAATTWACSLDPEPLRLDAEAQHQARELYASPTLSGMVDLRGRLDAATGATVLAALDAAGVRTGPDDARTPAQRRADALAAVCRHTLDAGTACGSDGTAVPVPDSGGERPHVLLVVDHGVLVGGAGGAGAPAELPGVGPVPTETARRLSCDATVSRVLTGPSGRTLDVGRATRTVPAALRRALVARDRGCVHPGCTRPPTDCDAHHLVHWADGGPTDADNLALVCQHHHRRLHEGRRTLHPVATTGTAGSRTGWRTPWVTAGYRCPPVPANAPPPASPDAAAPGGLPRPGPDRPRPRTPDDLFDGPDDLVGVGGPGEGGRRATGP